MLTQALAFLYGKENSLIGEPLGEDRSVVALILYSYNFRLRRIDFFQLEIDKAFYSVKKTR